MINKDFCCSSYLALRYIEKDNVDFFPGLKHRISTSSYNNYTKTHSDFVGFIQNIITKIW